MNLFGNEEVGIDGTFIRGNASKASIHTQEQLQKQLEKLNKKIDEYIEQLEQNDNVETDITTEDVELKIKLEKLKACAERSRSKRQATCQSHLTTLEESGEKQFSATDPDARLLNKRGTTTAGYNVQIAVDTALVLSLSNLC